MTEEPQELSDEFWYALNGVCIKRVVTTTRGSNETEDQHIERHERVLEKGMKGKNRKDPPSGN